MTWKVAQAKQHLSELLRLAASEPQVIQNRSRVVAVVVSPALAAELTRARPPLRELLAEARRICAETGYTLRPPRRSTRAVARHGPTDVPRRRQRRQ